MDARSATPGHLKVTRQDWLDAATAVLIERGVDQVKILGLATRLKVSRSSFYWYFHDRKELLDALLARWQTTNTTAFLAACAEPAATITGAVCNLFRCFLDARLFDARLELAVREWSKRAPSVRRHVARADETRLAAIRDMFVRHGYGAEDAQVRSRILYYMQIGYYALSPHETLEARLKLVPAYLEGFTGRRPKASEIAAFTAFAKGLS